MSETIHCPDCGQVNPPDVEHCVACNFPLREEPGPPRREPEPPPPIARPLPARPPRRRGAPRQALSLWLVFGFLSAATVVYVAIKANVDRIRQEPVEGSNRDQQKRADQLRAALARDSTDVEARVRLADVLYDTGNWPEAIVHYRSAVRQDSSRTPALVDLGVCFYNLGHPDEAERHFLLALQRDPHQPVALFNLGIVAERRSDLAAALSYFHRALQSGPPETMSQPLIEAMQRVQQAMGKTAPPLTGGR